MISRDCVISNTSESGLHCWVRLHGKSQGRIHFLCPHLLVSLLSANHLVNSWGQKMAEDHSLTQNSPQNFEFCIYLSCTKPLFFLHDKHIKKTTNIHNILHMSVKTIGYLWLPDRMNARCSFIHFYTMVQGKSGQLPYWENGNCNLPAVLGI